MNPEPRPRRRSQCGAEASEIGMSFGGGSLFQVVSRQINGTPILFRVPYFDTYPDGHEEVPLTEP